VLAMRRFPEQQARRAELGSHFEGLAAQVPGVRVMPHDPRITRWSFYRYVLAIDPELFAGRTNQVVCDALEAEGVGAWTGYEPMSNYDLFQPSLSRLPVALAHAERLDPSTMSFPVAEAAGLRESVYIDENVFRSDRAGVEQAVEALGKIQRNAAELPGG